MEEKKRLLSAVLFLALPFCISSKEIDIPVIKIPSSVLALDWNADSSVFAYSEANSVTIRDADDFSKIKTFSVSEENVQQLKFVANKEKSFEQLVTVSDSSELKIYRLPGIINTITRKFEDNDECRISFSKNGNYIASVTSENDIHVYLQLYISNSLTGLTLRSPSSSTAEDESESNTENKNKSVQIISLAFDSFSKKIAALRSDASVVIWNMSSVEPVTVIAGAYTKIPCMEFTEDSEKIIFASAEDTIEIKNFLGETVKQISCEDKINSFRLAEDKKTLIVLTQKNQFRYYALDSAAYLVPDTSEAATTNILVKNSLSWTKWQDSGKKDIDVAATPNYSGPANIDLYACYTTDADVNIFNAADYKLDAAWITVGEGSATLTGTESCTLTLSKATALNTDGALIWTVNVADKGETSPITGKFAYDSVTIEVSSLGMHHYTQTQADVAVGTPATFTQTGAKLLESGTYNVMITATEGTTTVTLPVVLTITD